MQMIELYLMTPTQESTDTPLRRICYVYRGYLLGDSMAFMRERDG